LVVEVVAVGVAWEVEVEVEEAITPFTIFVQLAIDFQLNQDISYKSKCISQIFLKITIDTIFLGHALMSR
jgi:hypothetical protein